VDWAKRNPIELRWLTEMMIRRDLGGYCPKDDLEFAFMSSVIAAGNIESEKDNIEIRLQNLINRSK